MTKDRTKGALSHPQRRLLELVQRINFGRIEGLAVRNGEPVVDPAPRVVREIKLGAEHEPRRELEKEDFVLKSQVVELFEHLTRLGNGEVERLEVKHGLPFLIHIEGVDRA